MQKLDKQFVNHLDASRFPTKESLGILRRVLLNMKVKLEGIEMLLTLDTWKVLSLCKGKVSVYTCTVACKFQVLLHSLKYDESKHKLILKYKQDGLIKFVKNLKIKQ